MSILFEGEDVKRRIIEAVKEDDVVTLRTLLDSPKLYDIRDEHGYGFTLLQISMLNRNISDNPDSTFEYLLSLEDYPVDAVNDEGQTALMMSLDNWYVSDGEYASRRLIQRGVDIHKVCHEGRSALHYAVPSFRQIAFSNTVLLLLKGGVDVNRQDCNGSTPLHECCARTNIAQAVPMLLYYGADPTVRNGLGHTAFDYLIIGGRNAVWMEESLFYYLFDEYTEYDIDALILLTAAVCSRSPLLEKVLKHIRTVFFNSSIEYLWLKLLVMKPRYLLIFIRKFDYVIKEILKNASEPRRDYYIVEPGPISVENFYILFESKLQSEFVEWLCEFDRYDIIEHCISCRIAEGPLTELVCFLLSYGTTMPIKYLDLIFEKFGYCELIKILLHMDLTIFDDYSTNSVMPRLLYDFTIDAQELIQDPLTLDVKDLKQILPYFAIPKLKNIPSDSDKLQDKDVIEKIQNQPDTPLLVEMARNVFRRYFVQKLNIKNARQFYTQLNLLPIGNYHKQIISLEVKLY